jgi:hypothetical protein
MLCVPLKRNHRANQRGGGLLFTLKYIHPATILPPSFTKLCLRFLNLPPNYGKLPLAMVSSRSIPLFPKEVKRDSFGFSTVPV